MPLRLLLTFSVTLAFIAPSLLAGAASAQDENVCKIAVTQIDAQGLKPTERHLGEFIADTIASELASSTACTIVTHQDIKAMLDFEAERAACGADSSSCLAEIGDALGVDMVIAGAVRGVGDLYQVNLQLIDIQQAKVIDRAEAAVEGEPARLRVESQNLVRQLFKLEPIPTATSADLEPYEAEQSTLSKVLIYAGLSTAGLGALALVLGTGMAGASYLITQTGSLDYGVKQAAASGLLLFGSVAVLGLLVVPAGLVVAGGGFVVE
jgi:TolB-like protein